ncbi:MAG TPA: response regulator [Polyangiaceae bacterium LLY-WYZ-15_(1-7)]|nr:response regulator [Polyangiaceae bacterium LLY-WYZ-15_(1-7)]HJL10580.1 response regulator [Polyangiaceae bacterium LLY-WYZ-15_(1-7)]HJL21815.1 response regulator [Polyangiaceae bacterium LLY-WYZ-15_(1-7)]HJL30559.1 response regulator [Polyangiaceae bacterium LLY-WYZ-15_(1-7)]HJL34374.1 response regulator [Polyangiaceae bacterium LLY-WYZ-15_(1-7)]
MSRPRLLLVDDDPDVRLIAEVSLEDRFEVVSVTSAEELLARVEELAPDVVLLDVMLPGDDGPTALRKLRERMEAPPPVVFLTARVLPDELSRWTSLGALGIIRKPFDPLSLPTEVLRLLDAREEPAP